MNCRAVRALAGAYALDALAEPERMEVDHHLDRCAACRAYVGKLSGAAASLAELVPPQAPPAALKQRILSAALQTAAVPPAGASRPGRRGHRAWSGAVRVAAAVALVALGWVAGRMAPVQPASTSQAMTNELTRVRLERDLWQALSPPGAAVMPLATDASMAGAVAYASVLGDERGCWVRLVAEGLPDPPDGMGYAVWVTTRGAEPRLTGQLRRAGSGRWELSARIDAPPARLGTLQVVLQDRATGGPGDGRPIAWGQLWPDGYEW